MFLNVTIFYMVRLYKNKGSFDIMKYFPMEISVESIYFAFSKK